MKNKKFFYQQYDKINWKNQEKTGLNASIYAYLTDAIKRSIKGDKIRLFDIGFGIGSFFRQFLKKSGDRFQNITLEGCEPSAKNFGYFIGEKPLTKSERAVLKAGKLPFLKTHARGKFDVITAIYVFPHILSDEIERVANKIFSMLDANGRFFLVLANERYLVGKLKSQRDLFIEENEIAYRGKTYKEFLHYSDIPEIGKVIDYNREEAFYEDVFKHAGFALAKKIVLNDHGFLCTIFVFKK